MQQGGRRLFRHPPVTVGHAGDRAFEQTQDRPDARFSVQRGDEVHLRRAGIGKADRDATVGQRPDQALGAVHLDRFRHQNSPG